MTRRKSFLYYERRLLDAHRTAAREDLGPDGSEEEIEARAQRYYQGAQRKTDDDTA